MIEQESVSAEKTCFVICPIGEEDSPVRKGSDHVFEEVIKRAIHPLGYHALRSDHIAKPGRITDQVIKHVVSDALVIADLSGHNPNVFYELAIRHAVNKPVIQLSRKGESLPFDVAQERTIFYEPESVKSVNGCIDEIKRQIDAIDHTSLPANPVAEIIQLQEALESRDELRRRYGELTSRIVSIDQKVSALAEHVPPKELLDQYRNEIKTLRSLKEAGIVSVHRNREIALRHFTSAIDAENQEIMVVGSSLLGLLQKTQYKELADKLKFKVGNTGVRVRFLLTHPAVSDLRAEQENRRFAAIGREIIESLRVLSSWGVNPSDVKLYKGTPTIFAIKTRRQMLLNPYAYFATAFTTPCLIVETDTEHMSYYYEVYDTAHFSAWDTTTAESISDFTQTISALEQNLAEYTAAAERVLKGP
jgi:hypothetical protein